MSTHILQLCNQITIVDLDQLSVACRKLGVAWERGLSRFTVLQVTGSWVRSRLHFFDCKGYRVVLDSALLSITGMTFLTSFPVRKTNLPQSDLVYL